MEYSRSELDVITIRCPEDLVSYVEYKMDMLLDLEEASFIMTELSHIGLEISYDDDDDMYVCAFGEDVVYGPTSFQCVLRAVYLHVRDVRYGYTAENCLVSFESIFSRMRARYNPSELAKRYPSIILFNRDTRTHMRVHPNIDWGTCKSFRVYVATDNQGYCCAEFILPECKVISKRGYLNEEIDELIRYFIKSYDGFRKGLKLLERKPQYGNNIGTYEISHAFGFSFNIDEVLQTGEITVTVTEQGNPAKLVVVIPDGHCLLTVERQGFSDDDLTYILSYLRVNLEKFLCASRKMMQ